MERGSSEIGVDDDSCCIDDAPEAWLGLTFKLPFEEGEETVKWKRRIHRPPRALPDGGVSRAAVSEQIRMASTTTFRG